MTISKCSLWILEVNGKLTLSTTKEEMTRLLTVCPSKAEIVVFRVWTPPPSTEDFLRRENLRLTHRISYLEDQVSELLILKENSLVQNKELKNGTNQTEVFQKGSHVALLPANSKGGCKSNPKIPHPERPWNDFYEQEKYDENKSPSDSHSNITNGYNGSTEKHHEDKYHTFHPKLYNGEKSIKSLSKKYEKEEFSSTLTRSRWKKGSEEDETNMKYFCNSNASIQDNYSQSDLEKSNRKSNHYNIKMVDYSSETSCHRYKPPKDRKVKSVDGDEVDGRFKQNSEYETELQNKPTPPKKPIRLSINRATSLQSVETGYSLHNAVRKMKRSHKGEAPQPPSFQENKINGNAESQYITCDSASSRTSSRAEPRKTTSDAQSKFNWTGNYNCSRSTGNEKWC